MYLLIVFLHLINALLFGLNSWYLGRKNAIFISVLIAFFSFVLAFICFLEVVLHKSITTIYMYNWINIYLSNIHIGFLFDGLTAAVLLVITLISFLVILFSIGYMESDPHLNRFLSYLSLFTFFMIILVTADNFLQLFIGWEGVGVCSYLLINFWFTRILANKAALKAMIMNRIADVFFIISLLCMYLVFNTLDFVTIFELIPYYNKEFFIIFGFKWPIIDVICFFLFIGSIGKSAQIGLHTWLPDAMEGPTPVSSLLHAATMVTAGIILILRCSPIFEFSNNILFLIILFGCIQLFFQL